MNKVANILSFRFKQSYRYLDDIGIGYIVLFLLVTISMTARFLEILTTTDNLTLGIIGFGLTLMVHLARKDKHFLSKLEIPKTLLYIVEYSLILLPIGLFLLLMGNPKGAAILQLSVLPVALIPAGLLQTKLNAIPLPLDFLPKTAFEFKAALRRFFITIVIFYLLALIASPFMGTLVLMSILIAILIPPAFEQFEPKDWIVPAYSKGNFILSKIIENSLLYHLLMLPHYVLLLYFHWQLWYIGLACFIAIELVIIFSIVYKYASYHPKREKIYSSTMVAVFLWTVLMPGFVIVSVFMIIRFWRKAQQNLANYYA